MATYTNEGSSSTAKAGLGLGIAGTALALMQNGGLGPLFGGGNQQTTLALAQKDSEIALLKAGQETDKKLVEVYNALFRNDKEMNAKIAGIDGRVLALETAAPLKEQIVDQKIARVADTMTCCCNAANAAIDNLKATLAGITKTVVPNSSVCPGWGPVTIAPETPAA
ncbi:MAG: hypothetical protein MJY89_09650 [Bacteroidales bacterium]|jgi:hypothetical protein|uniref:hypothetical protein n=1 Tax=unclassified Fibrobacter TaxID=2634177 RepID=UPI0009147C56|nr:MULTISPECIES: hypothetical protein [unclassified Fibrobacter]MCQ2183644.1 hypothetical protein [Bacteroidales bacterium]OWV05323.1 hypothetical protein B7993_08600 [Fibrobacter sp. UWH3]SHL28620.1 hypothetical protein SAMN05720765_11272 [Fibrobacter sp. UWH6]